MPPSHVWRIAIVGGGPRGLAACEAMAIRARENGLSVALTLFDPEPRPGAGPNYDPAQTELNRLNIPGRAISIPASPLAGADPVAGFARWAQARTDAYDEDHYPPRAELGRYLSERFEALVAALPGGVSLEHARAQVRSARRGEDGWHLEAGGEWRGPFDDLLLSPGHLVTEPDAQLARWQDHARESGAVLMDAYPSHRVLEASGSWAGRAVGIRGLGLSAIDVIGLLSQGAGGRFEEQEDGTLSYVASGREPSRIVPFSLDGLPPAPKPANARIDALYDVGQEHSRAFSAALDAALSEDPDQALATICSAVAEATVAALEAMGHPEVGAEIAPWLARERTQGATHEDADAPPAELLGRTLAMANGTLAPSPGYAIGQIWRKLQTPLRKGYNPRAVDPRIGEALVTFDEGLKRYSYGPPARAAAEMLALIEADLLDLRAADDPDIVTSADGWTLGSGTHAVEIAVMIDSVLSSPVLGKVDDPLIARLRAEGLLVPYGEGLGAHVTAQGQAIAANGEPVAGLSLVGRLAIGSVIATDSVHDCFGAAVSRWADAVAGHAGSAALSAAFAATS
ncbi:FAD/NAD(P)-binding protein [Pelagibacterium montanilacus]|uniref:FAD/NAD(P)-binding protein n=1 Tax=Pelagibacterium montanilacus TaxID=2185280 RepID=UPI000F8F354A|nr:FAD/NAD(P)-binding domain-containing protein [Pelagibacterium montanilacus]